MKFLHFPKEKKFLHISNFGDVVKRSLLPTDKDEWCQTKDFFFPFLLITICLMSCFTKKEKGKPK